MQTTAISFTKVEKKNLPIRTEHKVNLCFSVLLTMSNMKLLTVTNTVRLTLKTELINWGEADSKSFPCGCLEIFTKDSQEKYYSFFLLPSSLPPFLIHSTSAFPRSLQLCSGCYQLITD